VSVWSVCRTSAKTKCKRLEWLKDIDRRHCAKHENFEFDTGNFTDSFRFDARLKLFEFTLKNLYRREI
jgi:hypothetical protein